MEINFISESDFILHNNCDYTGWINAVIRGNKLKTGEISFTFVKKERILSINQEYLSHNYYTDIITFNDNVEKTLNGDVFICTDVVKENAKDYNQSFERELNRVIIHGVLHLCGFNDESEEQKNEMRTAEEKALDLLSSKFS